LPYKENSKQHRKSERWQCMRKKKGILKESCRAELETESYIRGELEPTRWIESAYGPDQESRPLKTSRWATRFGVFVHKLIRESETLELKSQ
jgi:hypothetical protein